MPTVIDSLIVRLGLDSRGMESAAPNSTKKLKDLEAQSKRTEEQVRKVGKGSTEAASGLEGLAGSVGKLLAVIGGSLALKHFIEDQIDANAQLGRFSKNLGLNVSTVSAWGNAVEEVGGSAQGLQGTLAMLSKSQTDLRLTGESSLVPYFSALGVALGTVEGQARPVDDILLDLADRFSKMDRPMANNMAARMGIDQGTTNLLLGGRKEVELTIARQKEYNAVSKQQAEQAAKQQKAIVDLKQAFTAFGRNLLTEAAPAIEKVLGYLTAFASWAEHNSQFIGDALKILAVGLAAVGLAALPIDVATIAVIALAAGIALLWQDYQTWKRGGQSLINWGPGISAAIEGIARLRKAGSDFFDWLDKKSGTKDAPARAMALSDAELKKKLADPQYRDSIPLQQELARRQKAATNGGGGGGALSGTQAQIQKYFTDHGWTPEQAAGIAANLWSESGGKANAVGDHGSAFGIAQWHADRQAAFKSKYGKDIKGSSLEEQLAFVQWELSKGNESGAGDALRKATSASQAGSIVSRLYERPADADGEARNRGSLAQTLMGVPGASASLAGAGSPNGGNTTTDKSITNHVGEIKVYTQATDAQGIAQDMGRGMDFLFTSHANMGLN